MTLNPLNMQMSVPRIPEASHIQQQAMIKPVFDQNELGQQSLKHTEQSRTQVQKTNEAENGVIRDDKEGNRQSQQQQQQKKKSNKQTEQEAKSIHPFKGHSIDIKL